MPNLSELEYSALEEIRANASGLTTEEVAQKLRSESGGARQILGMLENKGYIQEKQGKFFPAFLPATN